MTAPIYNRVALIGLGLIASSMAHAMRANGLVTEIVGHAKSAETRATALEIGICDRVYATAAEAVAGADLVVLAVPVSAMTAIAAEIGIAAAPQALTGAAVDALDDAVHERAGLGLEFLVDDVRLGLADALDHDLLGGLRGDAAEVVELGAQALEGVDRPLVVDVLVAFTPPAQHGIAGRYHQITNHLVVRNTLCQSRTGQTDPRLAGKAGCRVLPPGL